MEVICDHAGGRGCYLKCPHASPHEANVDTLICDEEECCEVQKVCCCVPVGSKVVQDDLLGRLKEQIERTEIFDPRVNQILIMEALVALLEAR